MSNNGPAWKADRLRLFEQQVRTRSQNRLASFVPYERQREFFELGATKRERLFMAGNQVGKSSSGAYETALHLTGLYPEWWVGKRFDHPTTGWACGTSAETVRDIGQTKLCGTPGSEQDFGTGFIPKVCLLGKTAGHGVGNGYDTIQVRHISGGTSQLSFKAYQQGRPKFEGTTLDFAWVDEEPPDDIYSEILARPTGEGIIFATLTPLLGYTPFINRFRRDISPEARRDRGVIQMGLKDAEHFTAEEKERRLASYSAHQRASRENGDPVLEGGAVWEEVIESDISTKLLLSDVPRHWPLLWGLDFGIAHPFAAVLIACDRDTDTIYVVDCFRMTGGTPVNHASRIKQIAPNAPIAWPHDGAAREAGSGEPLAALYKREGLRMLPSHAAFADGSISTEAGVLDMLTRMRDGRFKVASHLSDWWEEFRVYRRDEKTGQIVKIADDLMSATRIGVMAHRRAQPRSEDDRFGRRNGGWGPRPTSAGRTNPWTGRAVDAEGGGSSPWGGSSANPWSGRSR